MIKRRDILMKLSMLPLFGSIPVMAEPPLTARYRDYFKELGIRTFINAAGTYTSMTGSLMTEEVLEAIQYASRDYVLLDDLQDKVGVRIASLLQCESAMITSGAASAITLATAGVLSGLDDRRAAMIPDLEGSGMKSEVIMQKSHDIVYAHAIRNCGVKVRIVETRSELEKAINDKTALMFFVNANNLDGQIRTEEFVEIAKKHAIPTLNDCAADVPPVENLWKYTRMGFDLVCFSGGKGLRGPQSAGLLIGKKDLIAAARLNAPPRGNTIGRGMKVNKEEILGMMVALELYLTKDHRQEWSLWEEQVNTINDAIKTVPGVQTKIEVPPIANHIPTLNASWNTAVLKISGDTLKEKLRQGHPSIEVAGGGPNSISVTTWMLVPGQERIVASRVREIMLNAVA